MASQTLAKAAVRLRPCLWGRMPRVSNILPQSHPQQGRRLSPAADWPRFFLSAQARLPGQKLRNEVNGPSGQKGRPGKEQLGERVCPVFL